MNEAAKDYEAALRGMDDPNDESNTFEYESGLKLNTMTTKQSRELFIEAVVEATEEEFDYITHCPPHPREYDSFMASYMRPTIVADYEKLMQCDSDDEINRKADQAEQEMSRRKEERLMGRDW